MATNDSELELVILGTGAGQTFVYWGECSSAFVILKNGEPVLLCDLGYGVTGSCLAHVGSVPPHIYVSHNHGDHAGQLPLVLHVEAKAAGEAGRDLPCLYSHPDVMAELREHRLRELLSTGKPLESFASFHEVPSGRATPLGDTGLTAEPHLSTHSERCYGLLLRHEGRPVLGWTADSAYNEALYNALSEAPMLLLDARAQANEEHAGFDDIPRIAALPGLRGKPLLVTGYGRQDEAPGAGADAAWADAGLDVRVARPGMRVPLAPAPPPCAPGQPAAAAAEAGAGAGTRAGDSAAEGGGAAAAGLGSWLRSWVSWA